MILKELILNGMLPRANSPAPQGKLPSYLSSSSGTTSRMSEKWRMRFPEAGLLRIDQEEKRDQGMRPMRK